MKSRSQSEQSRNRAELVRSWLKELLLPKKRVAHWEPPELGPEAEAMYQAASERWIHHDALLWQVPALSLTGQAFLLTIALSADNSPYARTVASGLAILVSLLSIHLMTGHKQAAIVNAFLIAHYERWQFGGTVAPSSPQNIHGRNSEEVIRHITPRFARFGVMRSRSSFWIVCFTLFALAALANLLVTWLAPAWLEGTPPTT